MSAPRILFFFGGIVLFVLFAHYEANLTASMTSGPGRSTIKSFDDVIKGEYKVVVEDSTSMHIFMQTAQKGSVVVNRNRFLPKHRNRNKSLAKTASFGRNNLFQ